MNKEQWVLVHQYADAFLNVFGAELTDQDYEHINYVANFIEGSARVKQFLKNPLVEQEEKISVLRQMITKAHLPPTIARLIQIVVHHKRAFILGLIFKSIYGEYLEKNSIEYFTINTSHALSDNDRTQIEKFLSNETGNKIRTNVVIDPTLIAGLRLTSRTRLWEYSIRKQLNALRLMRKELYGH